MEVRLLTFNLFMRPPLVKNNASDHKEARLAYFIKHCLHKYDIICLQEMFAFGSSRRARLLEAAFKAGFNYSWASPAKRLLSGSIDGGLIILCRFPIRSRDFIVYPVGVHSDRFSDKGALYARIEVTPMHTIHLFVTHTQASYMSSPPVTEPSAIIRYQQLATLRKFINKHVSKSMRKPNEAILVVGDLNVNGRPPYDPANPASATGDSNEYKLMMKILRGEGIDAKLIDPGLPDATEHMIFVDSTIHIRDLLKESYYHHPVTFGDITVDENGHLQPRETVLAAKHDYCAMASLDYILSINEKPKRDVTGEVHFVYDVDRTKIEEFFVKEDYPFTQLSDHYGASTVLKVVDANK